MDAGERDDRRVRDIDEESSRRFSGGFSCAFDEGDAWFI